MAKKRQIMEKELNIEIQEELAAEVNMKREFPDVDMCDRWVLFDYFVFTLSRI